MWHMERSLYFTGFAHTLDAQRRQRQLVRVVLLFQMLENRLYPIKIRTLAIPLHESHHFVDADPILRRQG
jgi:hypothetical protein